jgi:hypothetical protein
MNIIDTIPELKVYERLDRHIRTANSLNELEHWDAIRAESTLSGAHDKALAREVEERVRFLTGRNK